MLLWCRGHMCMRKHNQPYLPLRRWSLLTESPSRHRACGDPPPGLPLPGSQHICTASNATGQALAGPAAGQQRTHCSDSDLKYAAMHLSLPVAVFKKHCLTRPVHVHFYVKNFYPFLRMKKIVQGAVQLSSSVRAQHSSSLHQACASMATQLPSRHAHSTCICHA